MLLCFHPVLPADLLERSGRYVPRRLAAYSTLVRRHAPALRKQTRTEYMRVKVQPINVNGTPIGTEERNAREIFPGELRMLEHRINDFGRAIRVAEVLINTDGKDVPSIQLHDAHVLWVKEKRMRIAGLEVQGTTKYGQTWDVELL